MTTASSNSNLILDEESQLVDEEQVYAKSSSLIVCNWALCKNTLVSYGGAHANHANYKYVKHINVL